MAETDTPEINCVYVDTNLDTHLVVLVHSHETISGFKEKLCKEHEQCFPKVGEISISAVKVKRQHPLGHFIDYHLPDSMYLSMAFNGVSNDCWFIFVDAAAVRMVDKLELPVTMDADENCSNHELLEKDKEIATDSLLLDGYTKVPEEDLETQVAEKTTKKRKLKSSDGEISRKKPLVDPNQSAAAAATASRFDVDENHESRGNVQVEAVASEFLPREKLDETLTEATGKEIEMGEKSAEDVGRDKIETDNLVSHPANDLDTNSGLTTRPDTEKKKKKKKRSNDDMNQPSAAVIATVRDIVSEITGVPANADRVDATPESLLIARGENFASLLAKAIQKENQMAENSVDDVGRDKVESDNVASHTANYLDSNNLEKETKKRRKKSSKDDINQSAAATITTSRHIVSEINGVPVTVDIVNAASDSPPISREDNLGNPFVDASQNENEMVEKSVEAAGRDKIETDNHLDTNSGLTTRPDTEKKKKKKKKRSEDDINQSSAATITTSRDIVNEINGVPANVDPVDATLESLPISKGNLFAESSQKEKEMVEKSVEDVGKHNIEDNSGLTTRPDTEKKKKRKKRSEDDINQSSAAAITTSRDIVNEINGVPANVDLVDATPESLPISKGNLFAESSQKENEMAEKSVEDVGRHNIEDNSGLTTRPDAGKKKKRKKSSKGDINQSFTATTTSGDIVNEINGVPGHVDRVDTTSESLSVRRKILDNPSAEARQKETETDEKIDDDVGSEKAIPSAADNVQTNNVEIDADEAKSVKPTKKKKSKKSKTPAEEDTLVASGAQNVEPIEVVDGERTDNVIRNVLDSLQEKNETEEDLEKTMKISTEENLEKTVKKSTEEDLEKKSTDENLEKTARKSSKKSKKKTSSKVVESQVLPAEVNNAALEETPPINNPKDIDASFFTPAKKDTVSDASLLRKSTEVADNAEDDGLSKKILTEKADMGDNFGYSQKDDDTVGDGKKQDQVAGGAKSKKEKKGLDLHPSGSINGSMSSMKPKEKKGRVQQPASSGTSHLQSMVKNDRSRTVISAVNSKKQDVKISSKPPTVDKRKTNFFEEAEKYNSSGDEYNKNSDVSTKTPSDYSSDDGDSDVTSMSRKQGNNVDGGTKFSGSLQDILRRSSSYKKALIRAQSQPDILDDVDCVPDSQAV